MTKKKLWIEVVWVSALLVVYAVICVSLRLVAFFAEQKMTRESADYWYTFFKDLIPLCVAIAAAFLAGSFQRRTSYLQALRELWKQMIPAVQAAIQYTHLKTSKQSDFAKVMELLSTAIDSLRSVFSNVKGIYPYDNLKDIQKTIEWLDFGLYFRTSSERRYARKCIIRLWQEMYEAMLAEFDRDVPLKPVSKFFHRGVSIADLLIDGKLTEHNLGKDKKPSNPDIGVGTPISISQEPDYRI